MEHRTLATAATTLVLYLLATAATAADVVVDIEGNPVVPGTYYYLLASNSNGGGGLSTVPMGSTTCPTNFIISQKPDRCDLGIPVAFFPEKNDDVPLPHHSHQHNSAVKVSANLRVYNKYYELATPLACPLVYSTFWALTGDAATGNIYVVLDGVAVARRDNKLARPDPAWFQIEKENKGYKIVFRPGVTVDEAAESVVEGQVAVLKGANGERVLTLDAQQSLVVHFVKA